MSHAGRKPLDGRIEKRIALTVPVHLASLKEPGAVERVLTGNVSTKGARVLTKKRWPPGEHLRITFFLVHFQLKAKVVYCQPLEDWGFCTGLEFLEMPANWPSGLWASFT
jgi:hypothetical protein